MTIQRVWAMPASDTFDVAPIGELVKRYLRQSTVSIDPFARNKRWCTFTNDLNPHTAAEHHRDALVFLRWLRLRGQLADFVIFDPPYSPRQIKECYDGIGLKMGGEEAWRTQGWTQERQVIDSLLAVGGVVISVSYTHLTLPTNREEQPRHGHWSPLSAARNALGLSRRGPQ